MASKSYGGQKFEWRRRKVWKASHGNQTPGKQKVESCQASSVDKFCATKGRAYKYECYKKFIAKSMKWNSSSWKVR